MNCKAKSCQRSFLLPLNSGLDFRLTAFVEQHSFLKVVITGYGHMENPLNLSEINNK